MKTKGEYKMRTKEKVVAKLTDSSPIIYYWKNKPNE